MYRTLLGIAALLLGLLSIVGLSFSASSERPADFVFVNETETPTLDPHLTKDNPGGRISQALFEGLTRLDARSMLPAPGVAERWEISPDQKVYTFFLRRDARWSDGVPITARDFVYSWRRLQDPSLGAEYAYILHMVRHAEALNSFDGLADEVRNRILPAFEKWRAEHPGEVAPEPWQRFLSAHRVHSLARHSDDARLHELLQQKGPLPAPAVERLAPLLAGLADKLAVSAEAARRHYGVDQGIYAKDDHTLVIELAAPTPYFLDLTSFYPAFPVPRHAVEARPQDWFLPETLVSNGPFRLQSWRPSDRIRLVKSETYWGRDDVKLEVIDALPTENLNTALNLYLTGAVDWVPKGSPPDLVDLMKERPDFHATPAMIVYFYRLNTTRPPLDDPRVREALSLGFDRQLITDEVMRMGQIPAQGIVPPGLRGYRSPATHLRYDVERARELLREAGFPDGRGFPRIGLLYNTNEDHRKVADVVSDQLRKNLGIEINPYNQEWQSFLETTRELGYDMARAGWVGDYLDPNTFLDMWVTNGGNNQTGFSSGRYDALIQAAANVEVFMANFDTVAKTAIPDEARRRAVQETLTGIEAEADLGRKIEAKRALRMDLLALAEEFLFTEAFPVIPVYFYVQGNLVRPEVKGFYTTLTLPDGTQVPNLQDVHPLRDLEVVRRGAPETALRTRAAEGVR